MRRWRWVTVASVALLGLAAGVAIAGRPEVPVDYLLAEPRSARVVVASIAGESEVAMRAADVLRNAGWLEASVQTAISNPGAVSRVYANPAAATEAQQAAIQLGLSSLNLLPMATEQVVISGDLDADIVIVLGDDFQG